MKRTLAALAVLLALPLVTRAQKPVTQTEAVEVTAKIEAIDKTGRLVTLKAIDAKLPSVTVTSEDGRTVSFKVEDKKNLKEVKVGDRVEITYTEAISISVR